MPTPVYNFSPGPAILPKSVLEQAQQELMDYQGSGMSVMELSHRGKLFQAIFHEAENDLRELLDIPENYKVLFLQGGAHTQFNMLALNFAQGFSNIDTVISGHWSNRASQEMSYLTEAKIHIAASSRNENGKCSFAPDVNQWQLSHHSAFVHFTSNETVEGIQYPTLPALSSDVPLICDMSSDLLSRPINVSDFGVIYAGAQKNIGPAGTTVVIIREDLLKRTPDNIPHIWNYKTFIEKDGMYNTPATYPIYIAGLVFKWLKNQGGLKAIEQINQQKATALYQAIDQSGGFYRNTIKPLYRSQMNVTFFTPDEKLDALFVQQADEAGLKTLKGYAAFGGIRASLYNAMPLEGALALAEFMQDFQKRYG